MELSKEAIKEFQDIYYKEFGREISDQEAQELGGNLLSLFRIVYHPLPKGDKRNQRDNNSNDSEQT